MNLLTEFNGVSVVFRILLVTIFSGVLGLERGNKRRPAGFRTYLLVGLGATIAMLIGQYESLYYGTIIQEQWGKMIPIDVSRIGAQVINGIGFLGAGTIIVTSQQEVKGLTTAAGLWASACMGLAIGVGCYECAVFGFVLIIISFKLFPSIEYRCLNNSPNMNIYIEFDGLRNIHQIITEIKSKNIDIYEVELIDHKQSLTDNPAALFTLFMYRKENHENIIGALSELDYVLRIDEI